MNFGLRHRAAFGISEDTEALAIVISEEHNTISTFIDGKINSDLSIVNLRSIINEYLETDIELN
jgi:DNA integrity scanning protein DisA with diadenylate cyclase activity